MISHFLDEHKNNTIDTIFLTVNKNNSGPIAAYKKMGFTIVDEITTDIGNGFFMDDYKMQLIL